MSALKTRDGHEIHVHYWQGKADSIYVQPDIRDFPQPGDPVCGWTDEYSKDRPCELKQGHTCGHATEISLHWRSLYSEEEGSA